MPPCEPVGADEIAERLGVKPNTVHQWRQRTNVHFPAPEWTVSGRPCWNWPTIARWAKDTGRLT